MPQTLLRLFKCSVPDAHPAWFQTHPSCLGIRAQGTPPNHYHLLHMFDVWVGPGPQPEGHSQPSRMIWGGSWVLGIPTPQAHHRPRASYRLYSRRWQRQCPHPLPLYPRRNQLWSGIAVVGENHFNAVRSILICAMTFSEVFARFPAVCVCAMGLVIHRSVALNGATTVLGCCVPPPVEHALFPLLHRRRALLNTRTVVQQMHLQQLPRSHRHSG